MIELSMSMLDEFYRCRRKWYYHYVLGLEPKGKNDKMMIGSAFHAGLAEGYRYYHDRKNFVAIAQAGFSNWLNTLEDAQGFNLENVPLVEDMIAFWWQHEGQFREYQEILSVELPIPLSVGKYTIRCTPDLVARESGGRLAMPDHKTVDSVKDSLAFLPMDFQLRCYSLSAWDRFGEIPEADYNMQRREVPPGFGRRPIRYNKDGSISKNNASTNPEDYVRFERQIFTPKQLIAFAQELEAMCDDMMLALESKRYPRSRVKNGATSCSFCPYLAGCIRELDGEQLDAVTLSLEFNRRPSILEPAA